MIIPHSHPPDEEQNPRHMVSLECLNRWADRCEELEDAYAELEAINQELLEALDQILYQPPPKLGGSGYLWVAKLKSIAEAAIAKARGEEVKR